MTTSNTTIETITLTIDDCEVTVDVGTTIWEAARRAGIEIPALCHLPDMQPVGVCRMCIVDVDERLPTASCVRACTDGMRVVTSSETIEQHRRMLVKLLLSDHPIPCEREQSTRDCELEDLGRRYGLIGGQDVGVGGRGAGDFLTPHSKNQPAYTGRSPSVTDLSSPVIAVEHQSCILCDRCVRACDDIQANHVIGRTGKGYGARIGFDLDAPMGESTCVSCGECVSACPTGALTNKQITLPIVTDPQMKAVDTVCPYCGVGCAITYHTRDNQIVYADGRDSPVNHARLCVKGRYGWDYATHPHRLTKPLIRRDEAYPKGPLSSEVKSSSRAASRRGRKSGGIVDYDEVMPAFREATWEEALDLAAGRFREIKETHGGGALAGFGSAKCSNEEAYLFQKLIRAGFGTNNVDHCTRLCHASSVAALMETIGSGAVTNVFADVARADVVLVTGSHASSNHPVAATFIKNAAERGTKLVLVDVRRNELADFATHFAQIKPGSDVAFYNAVMHVLLRDGLIDETFVAERTEGFEELRALLLAEYSPQQASHICGIDSEQITEIARTIGEATPPGGDGSMIVFWGMGIAQHTTGTDNARCLISLCLLTGNVGKPGSGLHPLRGQNNVQGASDAGLIPMVYPDYQPVADAAVRAKFEAAWGVALDPNPGLTVVEIMDGALEKKIRGMYIMGENPFISDPNSNKVREALSRLDFLAVQDIFLTETAEFADVIFPAGSYLEKMGTYTNTDRRVQLGHTVLDLPGEARHDWQILCDLGRRLGMKMHYDSPEEIFDEFASLTKNYNGLSHKNLGPTGKLWPCDDPSVGDGTQILFSDRFPTPSGKGKFVACRYQPADELPDDEYPFILSTGRVLEHWHSGSMTRRSLALSTIEPEAFSAMHPDDLKRLGIEVDCLIRVSSRRGTIELKVRADRSIKQGSIFIPFHFREAAANILTTDALDPYGKIPEFKFCAVKVESLSTIP